jgi:hypothetical protein
MKRLEIASPKPETIRDNLAALLKSTPDIPENYRRNVVIKKSLTTLVLVSALAIFGALSHAKTPNAEQNTSPNQPPSSVPNQPPNTVPNQPPNMPNANANQPTRVARALTVPFEFQPGIAALNLAKNALEQAGDKWGGHRVKAIHLIDLAFLACGQRAQKPGEMKSGATDNPQALQTGITELTNAKALFSKSQNAWGGRRDKAIGFMTQALQELQAASAFVQNRAPQARR